MAHDAFVEINQYFVPHKVTETINCQITPMCFLCRRCYDQ